MPFLSDKRTGPKGSKRKLQFLDDSVTGAFKGGKSNKPVRGAGSGPATKDTGVGSGRALKNTAPKSAAASSGKTTFAGAGGSTAAMRGAGGSTRMGGSGASGRWGSSATAKSAPMLGGRSGVGSAKAAPAKPAAPKPVAKATKAAYKAKGIADYNKDVGSFYLNATSGMFSDKAGGKKKR